MSEKPPKKSTKGRKTMNPGDKTTVIRPSIPTDQAAAAHLAAESQGLTLSKFVEAALKEAIYQAIVSGKGCPKNDPEDDQQEPQMLAIRPLRTERKTLKPNSRNTR